jgi:hypothetical protein
MKPYLLLATALAMPALEAPAATKQPAPPDRELLKMMDLLSDWEVIQHMEKVKEIEQLGSEDKSAAGAGRPATAPVKRKETRK